MNETYCGKSCDQCEYKISEQCPGCAEGPGHKEYGACELAKCCRNKGHEKCSMCRFDKDCYLLRDKDYMPEEMAKKTKVELEKRKRMIDTAPLLAYWANILFILNILSFIFSFFVSDYVAMALPAVASLSKLIVIIVQVVSIIGMYKLSVTERKYKMSAICLGVSLIISVFSMVLTLFLPWNSEKTQLIIAAISLVATVISYFGLYYEIIAHASVLRGIDNVLGSKWLELWKLTAIMLGLMIAGYFTSPFIAGIASVLILASGMLGFFITISKIMNLNKMAKVFASQIKEDKENNEEQLGE